MVAQQCGLKVGEFVWTGGDTHLYTNHLEQAKKQLGRDVRDLPQLKILRKAPTLWDYTFEDFVFENYKN